MIRLTWIWLFLFALTTELVAQTPQNLQKNHIAKGIIVPASAIQTSPANPLVYKDESIVQFKNLGVNQGLKSSYAYALLNDHRGNLWIGSWSKGLIRFDGRSFGHYEEHWQVKNSHIWKLFEDSKQRIWMGTRQGGAICFDGINYTVYKDTIGGLRSNQVYDIYEDSQGSIWFATSHGISKLQNHQFTHFDQADGLGRNIVRTVVQDHEGTIWAGTWGAGLYKFDGTQFHKINVSDEEPDKFAFVWTILVDRSGNLWISNWGEALVKYDHQTFTIYDESDGLPNLRIRPLFEDQSGKIWVGTEAGVAILENQTFTTYDSDDGLNSNFIYSITQDQEGIIWIGTEGGGLNQFSQSSFEHFTVKDGLTHEVIQSMGIDQYDQIWFGGKRKGINIYDGEKFSPFKYNSVIGGWGVRCIFRDPKTNIIYIGTWGRGIFVYNEVKDLLVNINKNHGLVSDYILDIQKDNDDNIWLGSYEGLMQISSNFNPFIPIDKINNTQLHIFEEFKGSPIRIIEKDQEGNFWIGTQGIGLFHYDGNGFRQVPIYSGMKDLSIMTLCADSKEHLWIGSGMKGASYFNVNEFYTEIEQIPYWKDDSLEKVAPQINLHLNEISAESGILASRASVILESQPGVIWIATDAGISEIILNGDSYDSRFFNAYDGFTGGGVILNAGIISSQGNIWWGTGKHLSRQVTTYKKQEALKPPLVYISDVKLLAMHESWQETKKSRTVSYDSLTAWEGLPTNLSLSYDNNYISFTYRGINWKEPEKTRYQYQLEGLETSWNPITNQTNISYANLKPNTYTFKVRAINTKSKQSEISAFTFKVRPPFWQEIWFRICLGIGILGLAFFVYKWNTQRLQAKWESETLEEQRKELAYLVEERTRELKRSNEELERFAYIASHDLKTPLRSIISFLGLIERKTGHLDSDIQEYVLFAKESATQMHELIQGILSFSRLEKVEKSEVDLNEVLQKVKTNLQDLIQQKEAQISHNSLPVITADQTQMIQLFQNLIENGITYNKQIPPKIQIRYQLKNNKHEFQIVDNGIGIPKKYYHKIFKMFARLHSSQDYKGTGLGLALCEKVVKLHGGEIHLNSKEGKGSIFTVSFPS